MFGKMDPLSPIGIFDSGLGGLAVLRIVNQLLPKENVIFLGDTQRQPYGPRTIEEVRLYTLEITGYLIKKGVKMVIIGCNTASVAGGDAAQDLYPELPVLGMIRPGVEAAIRTSQTKRIGIWGTEVTIASMAYDKMLIAADPRVQSIGIACPTLLRLAEKGKISNEKYLLQLAAQDFEPIAQFQSDTLILGCTDFTCVRPIINQVVDGRVTIVDPAEEVVLETRRLLEQGAALNPSPEMGKNEFFVTGDDIDNFATFGAKFLGVPKIDVTKISLEEVQKAVRQE